MESLALEHGYRISMSESSRNENETIACVWIDNSNLFAGSQTVQSILWFDFLIESEKGIMLVSGRG